MVVVPEPAKVGVAQLILTPDDPYPLGGVDATLAVPIVPL